MVEQVDAPLTEVGVSRPPAAPPTSDRLRRNRIVGLSLALAVFLLDQLTKWIVTYPLGLGRQPNREMQLFDFFTLRWVENRGVSMGFLTADSDTGRWLLVALTAAISLLVLAWLWREQRRDDSLALSFILGGAIGNIVDRVRYGYVVDFADLHIGDIHPFLVFNVADAAITIGVLLLLVRALLTRGGTSGKEK